MLGYCWPTAYDAGPAVNRHRFKVCSLGTQQTRHIDPMLDHCWPTVYDVGQTLDQHRVDVFWLLGKSSVVRISVGFCSFSWQVSPQIRHVHSVAGLRMAHHPQRWPIIRRTFGQRVRFARKIRTCIEFYLFVNCAPNIESRCPQ